MKKIIATTDFSNSSLNALLFAAELAKRSSARLIILNIVQKEEVEEDARYKLQSIIAEFKSSFGIALKCESLLAKGNFINSLKKIITEKNPDLLVMGTKGATGLKKILMGTNTVNVISKIKVPTLVIPEDAEFKNFLKKRKNRIVLATDLDLLENKSILKVLKKIVLLIIEPKIRVLSVRPEGTFISDSKSMERDFLLSYFRPEIGTERMTIFSKSVMGGINYYLDDNSDTGLLAMIARDSGNIFKKHYTREMAAHTHLPLLVLHDSKI